MNVTRLTKSDLRAIETEVDMIVGEPPTIEDLINEGHTDTRLLNAVIDTISGTGRVLTLIAAEVIQSLAALIILVVFAALEYQRVERGAVALGQPDGAAVLIAGAVVTANIVHPIYALRGLRGQNHLDVTKMTVRGFLGAFWRRLTGQPTVEAVDLYHNPTLHLAAAVITWSTVTLAVYDILGPLLTELFSGGLTRPLPIAGMELLMGLGLSVAGVFFLQSAAHEIGVRTLTDQPQRLTDILEQRQAAHQAYTEQVREGVRNRYMAGKMAAAAQQEMNTPVNPTGAAPVTMISSNGAGKHPG